MEASGTSNMKFAMNGCLIIGTLDGANVEIEQEIGSENIFIFGAKAHEVEPLRKQCREGKVAPEPRLAAVLAMIENDKFGNGSVFAPILNALKPQNDYYLLNCDFAAYIQTQEKVDATWRNQPLWTRMSIMSTAGSGKFSSDRTIKQYAEQIWDIKTQRRPGPVPVSVERLGSLGIVSAGALKSLESDDAGSISLERMTPKERISLSPSISPSQSPRLH
jgi:starch phosphorylase